MAPSEKVAYSDHDLLIMLMTKMEGVERTVAELSTGQTANCARESGRIQALEDIAKAQAHDIEATRAEDQRGRTEIWNSVNDLKRSRDENAGRASVASVYVAYAFSGISTIIAVVSLIMKFKP